jgi:signal peptidase II
LSRRTQNWLVLFGVAGLVLIADGVSKALVANNLSLYETHVPPVIDRFVQITYTTNTGAAFGLFPNHGTFFVIVAVVIIVAIIVYYRQLPDGYALARVALGLQLGGAVGNLIDRLRQGYVVDFVDLNFWPLQDWPIFNLADSAVVVGVVLLAFSMLREDMRRLDDELDTSEGDTTSEQGAST